MTTAAQSSLPADPLLPVELRSHCAAISITYYHFQSDLNADRPLQHSVTLRKMCHLYRSAQILSNCAFALTFYVNMQRKKFNSRLV